MPVIEWMFPWCLLLLSSIGVAALAKSHDFSEVASIGIGFLVSISVWTICAGGVHIYDKIMDRRCHYFKLGESEFPKCTELDELSNIIDAKSIRNYIDSLPDIKRGYSEYVVEKLQNLPFSNNRISVESHTPRLISYSSNRGHIDG